MVGMRRVVAIAFAALALAGCGGSSGGDAQQTLTVKGGEMFFDPPNPVVQPGAVTITFDNSTANLRHELLIKGPDGEGVGRTSAAPGETKTLTVEVGEGVYEMGCFEPGHYEAGMKGTLTVRS